MLRIHFMQQWFSLGDPAMEEAFPDTPLYRDFAQLPFGRTLTPGKRRKLDKDNNPVDALIDQGEKIKACIRARVEHLFRVIKRQFGFAKVRYRGLKKNTLQIKTLFASVQLVDGPSHTDGGAGMSAFINGKGAQKPEKTPMNRAASQLDSV